MTDDDQAPLATQTQMALLRRDFENMSSDIAEIKSDFKDLKKFYATKEELAYFKSEWKTAHGSLYGELREWKRFVTAVGVIVVAAVILAYFFHIPRVG